MDTIISTVKSFYSPTHYEWAAYERTGIGLSYIFGLTSLLCIVSLIGLYIAANYFGVAYANIILSQFAKIGVFSAFLTGVNNTVLLYAITIALISFGMTLYVINFAIIIAVIAMPINYVMFTKLTYDQLLRITVYATVPPSIILAATIYLTETYDPTSIKVLFMIFTTFYEFYAIICAKRYLTY